MGRSPLNRKKRTVPRLTRSVLIELRQRKTAHRRSPEIKATGGWVSTG
jgi:hypothetical protein